MNRIRSAQTPLTCLAASLAALFLAKPGHAQELDPPGPDAWRFSAGVGAISQPKYPGSGSQKTTLVPLVSASYGRYFIGGMPGAGVPAGIGAFLVQDAHWRLGVGLGGSLEKPRKESDSPRLRGLGDIPRTALGSVFASYNDRYYSLRGSVQTDIGGHHEGTSATLDLEGRYPFGDRLVLSAGPSVTWVDSKYNRTFFGIDATQSAASGQPVYEAGSGIEAIRFNVGANYRLTPNWGLGARFSVGSLRGDAGSSPITEKKQQNSLGVFATYRF